MCIARAILAAERTSVIKNDPHLGAPDPKAGRDGWIEQIFSMAITGYKLSKIDEAFDNITFVNFNYDRCIEHYIYFALQRIGLTTEAAARIVTRLQIIRPYGGLGSIIPGEKQYLGFGSAAGDYFTLVDRIRTFAESEIMHDGDVLLKALSSASLIVFLGFGFHVQNIDLLALEKPHAVDGLKILATTFKVNHAVIPELKSAIATTLRVGLDRVETYPMTASEIVKELRIKINLMLR